MTRHVTATRLFPGLSVLLLSMASNTAGLAQTPAPTTPPTPSQLTIVRVKPDMGAAWQEYLKNDANPAASSRLDRRR